MKVKALFTGFDLTEGKVYDVCYSYDTVYEIQCDTGRYCRNKDFFEVVEEPKSREEMDCDDLSPYCPIIRAGGNPSYSGPNGPSFCEGSRCAEAYAKYLEEFEPATDILIPVEK